MAFIMRRSQRLFAFGQIPFLLYVASFSQFLGCLLSGYALNLSGLDVATVEGIAIAKLLEAVLIVVPALILIPISGAGLGSVYIKKGNLRKGLTSDFVGFIVMALLAVGSGYGSGIEFDRMINWTPWILVFVLANGFMEELLFRGLFLGRLSPTLELRTKTQNPCVRLCQKPSVLSVPGFGSPKV